MRSGTLYAPTGRMSRLVVWFVGVLSIVSGCTGYCEDPHVVVSSSDTQPGSLRAGVVFNAYGNSIAARSDGSVLCLTCTAVLTLDQRLRETDRIDVAGPPGPAFVAVAPDDSIYAIVRPPASNAPRIDLAAFEPTGALRWQKHFAEDGPSRVVAGAEGPYIELRDPGEPFPGESMIVGFDAASGEPRQLSASGQRLLGIAQGGVFTLQSTESSVTLRYLDPAGSVVWERKLTTASSFLRVEGVVATPSGGGIFVGRSEGTVDFGDRVIDNPTQQSLNLVFEIDRAGATRWAFTHPGYYTDHVALTEQGDILLAGRLDVRDDGTESFLSLATPAGIVRTHRIGGVADQDIMGLAASMDGLAWVQVSSYGGEDQPDPVLRIGEHEFEEAGTYLFGIVP